MYIPIALLYNERGVLKGMRFFQWCITGEELVHLRFDTCMRFYEKKNVVIARSGVVEFSMQELNEFNCPFYDYIGTSERVAVLYICQYISSVLSDGAVLDDTVTVVYEIGDSDLIVVDSSGQYNCYNRADLYTRCSKLGIHIAGERRLATLDVVNGLKYATKDFKTRLANLKSQCEIMGLIVKYYPHNGKLECRIETQGEVIVPKGIDEVIVEPTCEVTGLNASTARILLCESNTLCRLKAPEIACWFSLHASCPMSELSFPKKMRRWSSLSKFVSQFMLYATDIPLYLTEIDQSDYDIDDSEITVLGSNNLQKLRLMYAGEDASPRVFIKHSECLHEIEVLKSPSGGWANSIQIRLGSIVGNLDINCAVGARLKLYTQTPETGILTVRCAKGVKHVSAILSVPCVAWRSSEGKRLAVILCSGTDLAMLPDSNTSNAELIGLTERVQVESISEARELAEGFCYGADIRAGENGSKVLLIDVVSR